MVGVRNPHEIAIASEPVLNEIAITFKPVRVQCEFSASFRRSSWCAIDAAEVCSVHTIGAQSKLLYGPELLVPSASFLPVARSTLRDPRSSAPGNEQRTMPTTVVAPRRAAALGVGGVAAVVVVGGGGEVFSSGVGFGGASGASCASISSAASQTPYTVKPVHSPSSI